MLPDSPEIKKRLLTLVQVTFRQRVRQHGVIGAIKEAPYFEGNRFESRDVDGNLETSQPRLMAIPVSVEKAEIIERGVDAYAEAMMGAAAVQQQNLAQMLYQKMDEVTARTGNRIDAGGRSFGPDLFLDLLETVDIDFDETGQPDLSSVRIVVHPQLGEHIRAHAAEWEADPTFQKRHAEIIEKKRAEWRDRESNRKLVD